MSYSREELYPARIQCKFEEEGGGTTYWINGEAKCLGNTHGEGNEGRYCQYPSGYGTEHKGRGRCKYHGGAVISKPTVGRYSKIAKNQLKLDYENFLTDPKTLNLADELAIQKTILAETIRKHQEGAIETELILKISQAIVETVSKIEKIQSNQVLSTASARLMMARAVETMKNLADEWFEEDEAQERLEQFMIRWQRETEIPR